MIAKLSTDWILFGKGPLQTASPLTLFDTDNNNNSDGSKSQQPNLHIINFEIQTVTFYHNINPQLNSPQRKNSSNENYL